MNPKHVGIGILVLAIIGFAVTQFSKEPTKNQEITQVNMMNQGMPPANSMMARGYKNGIFTATGNYISPAQEEEVEITVTLKDGVVTDAQFSGKATNETSKMMQGLFSEGFTEKVVGKHIDNIHLTVVNGSSLTPKGFMDALKKVKKEAKA